MRQVVLCLLDMVLFKMSLRKRAVLTLTGKREIASRQGEVIVNMKKALIMTIICSIVALGGYCFAECDKLDIVDLVGKRVQIHGPYYLDYIGMARNEKTCDFLVAAAQSDSARLFEKVFAAYDIMLIENHAPAMVIKIDAQENMAKVYIFSGLYKGTTGWVPLQWLSNNKPLISFRDTSL